MTEKLSPGGITTSDLAANAVTLAKLATQGTNTYLANNTASAAVPAAVAMPFVVDSSINGLLGWTDDSATAGTAKTPVAAKIVLRKLLTPESITIANILITVTTAGNSYTNTQVGVYNSSGTLIGASAVLASAGTNTFGSTGTATIAVTVIGGQSLAVAAGAFVWVALHMGTNATTACQFAGQATTTAVSIAAINAGLTAATFRACAQTGHATNPLATIGNLTPSSNSESGASVLWMGVT